MLNEILKPKSSLFYVCTCLSSGNVSVSCASFSTHFLKMRYDVWFFWTLRIKKILWVWGNIWQILWQVVGFISLVYLSLQATGFLWSVTNPKSTEEVEKWVNVPLKPWTNQTTSTKSFFEDRLVHVNSSDWSNATSRLSVKYKCKVHYLSHSGCRKLGQLWGWVREAIVKKWRGRVRGGLNGLTGGRVLLTGLNLKEKSPSYDERSTEYVSANWLSFFFFFLNLVLADASNPLLWKPNDLRPASSPLPPHLLYLCLVQEYQFLRKLGLPVSAATPLKFLFLQNECWWQISKGQTIKPPLWSFAFFLTFYPNRSLHLH